MALLDTHYPLGRHNTFRFEATARYAAHVRTPEDIPAALADPRVQESVGVGVFVTLMALTVGAGGNTTTPKRGRRPKTAPESA